jgi:predicted RNA binding protein YcfA (HicA-like mRNA interferase family)
MPKKVKEMVKIVEADGWFLISHDGTSHRHFRHPTKPGKVTIAGKDSSDLKIGTEISIYKQAGIPRRR